LRLLKFLKMLRHFAEFLKTDNDNVPPHFENWFNEYWEKNVHSDMNKSRFFLTYMFMGALIADFTDLESMEIAISNKSVKFFNLHDDIPSFLFTFVVSNQSHSSHSKSISYFVDLGVEKSKSVNLCVKNEDVTFRITIESFSNLPMKKSQLKVIKETCSTKNISSDGDEENPPGHFRKISKFKRSFFDRVVFFDEMISEGQKYEMDELLQSVAFWFNYSGVAVPHFRTVEAFLGFLTGILVFKLKDGKKLAERIYFDQNHMPTILVSKIKEYKTSSSRALPILFTEHGYETCNSPDLQYQLDIDSKYVLKNAILYSSNKEFLFDQKIVKLDHQMLPFVVSHIYLLGKLNLVELEAQIQRVFHKELLPIVKHLDLQSISEYILGQIIAIQSESIKSKQKVKLRFAPLVTSPTYLIGLYSNEIICLTVVEQDDYENVVSVFQELKAKSTWSDNGNETSSKDNVVMIFIVKDSSGKFGVKLQVLDEHLLSYILQSGPRQNINTFSTQNYPEKHITIDRKLFTYSRTVQEIAGNSAAMKFVVLGALSQIYEIRLQENQKDGLQFTLSEWFKFIPETKVRILEMSTCKAWEEIYDILSMSNVLDSSKIYSESESIAILCQNSDETRITRIRRKSQRDQNKPPSLLHGPLFNRNCVINYSNFLSSNIHKMLRRNTDNRNQFKNRKNDEGIGQEGHMFYDQQMLTSFNQSFNKKSEKVGKLTGNEILEHFKNNFIEKNIKINYQTLMNLLATLIKVETQNTQTKLSISDGKLLDAVQNIISPFKSNFSTVGDIWRLLNNQHSAFSREYLTRNPPLEVINMADLSKHPANVFGNSDPIIVKKINVFNMMNMKTFFEPLELKHKTTPNKIIRGEGFTPIRCRDKLVTVDKNMGQIVRFEIYKQNCPSYNITLIVNSSVKFENHASFGRFTYFVTRANVNLTVDEYSKNAWHTFSVPYFGSEIKSVDVRESEDKMWSYTIIFYSNNHLRIVDVHQKVVIHLKDGVIFLEGHKSLLKIHDSVGHFSSSADFYRKIAKLLKIPVFVDFTSYNTRALFPKPEHGTKTALLLLPDPDAITRLTIVNFFTTLIFGTAQPPTTKMVVEKTPDVIAEFGDKDKKAVVVLDLSRTIRQAEKITNESIEFSVVHFVQKLIVRLRISENFTIIHQVAIDNIDYVKHQVILVDKLYLTYDPELESLIPVPIQVSGDTEILILSMSDIQRNSTVKIDRPLLDKHDVIDLDNTTIVFTNFYKLLGNFENCVTTIFFVDIAGNENVLQSLVLEFQDEKIVMGQYINV